MPDGAMKRLGQLSLYRVPGAVRCKKSPEIQKLHNIINHHIPIVLFTRVKVNKCTHANTNTNTHRDPHKSMLISYQQSI